ncbi:hypothetical protein [uncultured Shewanella sp.]|uniref:hypothetical protein n=1 Tax=uncultured Shewanella sp. TaxID=173975 RepID=UPI00262E9D20|nr:hypothetical protein [uncultured Shewanella sp.]
MGFSRKKWNNIIIIASLIMISVLSILYDKTQHLPLESTSPSTPLFDDNLTLVQLTIGSFSMKKSPQGWHCSSNVKNCQHWAETWANLHMTSISTPAELPETAQQIIFYVNDFSTPQIWQLFSKTQILKSPHNNWYHVSIRPNEHLLPKGLK